MNMHKLIKYAGIILGSIGVLFNLLGSLSYLIDIVFFHVKYYYSWFLVGNSFIFMGIFLLLLRSCFECKKEA